MIGEIDHCFKSGSIPDSRRWPGWHPANSNLTYNQLCNDFSYVLCCNIGSLVLILSIVMLPFNIKHIIISSKDISMIHLV